MYSYTYIYAYVYIHIYLSTSEDNLFKLMSSNLLL